MRAYLRGIPGATSSLPWPPKATRLSSQHCAQGKSSKTNVPSAAVKSGSADGSSQQLNGQGNKGAGHTPNSPQEPPPSVHRRQALLALSLFATSFAQSKPAHAADSTAPAKEENPLDSIASFLDPDELAASGRKIPKAYKKQVREVVKTLKESLSEQQAKDFRRKADPAKEAIRGYIVNWRGVASVQSEESYTALERVLRALGAFYQKAGPSARVTDELREQIFKDLDLAENSL